MYSAMTPWRVMVNTAAVLIVLGMAWLLIQIKSIIFVLVLGILLAAAIEPLVNRLRRRGLSRGQAIMTVYGILVAVLVLTIYLVVPPMIRQATAFIDEIPTILANLEEQANTSRNDFIRTSGARTLRRAQSAYRELRQNPSIEGSTAFTVATSVVGVLATVVSVMIVAFYWMTEKAIIKRLVLGLFSLQRRDRAHALWDEIEHRLGGWTRGQLTLCLVIGTFSGIAYSPLAIDLDFWLPLAIWAGLTEIVPFIGPFIGGGTAAIVALADDWRKALLVAGFVIVLQQLENAVLVPRIMRNAVGMTPLTVILAVLVGGAVLGPLGAILAIPVGAAVQVVVQDLLRNREDDADVSDGMAIPTAAASSVPGESAGTALTSRSSAAPTRRDSISQ